ncbi:hypothetical protein J6590_100197, partial [Homalodisca vitripennis]
MSGSFWYLKFTLLNVPDFVTCHPQECLGHWKLLAIGSLPMINSVSAYFIKTVWMELTHNMFGSFWHVKFTLLNVLDFVTCQPQECLGNWKLLVIGSLPMINPLSSYFIEIVWIELTNNMFGSFWHVKFTLLNVPDFVTCQPQERLGYWKLLAIGSLPMINPLSSYFIEIVWIELTHNMFGSFWHLKLSRGSVWTFFCLLPCPHRPLLSVGGGVTPS